MVDSHHKRRRKSLSIFRQQPSPLTIVTNDPTASDDPVSSTSVPDYVPSALRQKPRPASIVGGRSSSNPASPVLDNAPLLEKSESPKLRPKVLHRGPRTSMFGSLRSLKSLDDEEKLTKTQSKASSLEDDEQPTPALSGGTVGEHVLHFGEVQSGGGTMFRKKSSYFVLTESHLLRFKSQARAAEIFPAIPPSLGRSSGSRQSLASIGSYKDYESTLINDLHSGVKLDQIIAVSRLDDGRPYFTIEVSYLDDKSGHHSTIHMQLGDPRERDLWLSGIRNATSRAKERLGHVFPANTLQYIARLLERERDYDPDQFRVFKVVRRAASKTSGRSSVDDLSKLSSSICYFAVGINRIHLIPPSRGSHRTSSTSLTDMDTPVSYGVLSLTSFAMQSGEDAFQMVFRVPTTGSFALHLASSTVEDIGLWVRHRAEYLRPAWTRQPFSFKVPKSVLEKYHKYPSPAVDEDHYCFERTLIAHCSAYDVDTSRITYTIDYDCEDAPCFRLLPASKIKPEYHPLELIALFRSLRYNETFNSISFSGINLDGVQSLYDPYGTDPDAALTRQGTPTRIDGQENLSILASEVRALCLKSPRLRRLDFGFSLTKVPEDGNAARSNACGIPEAIMPLCKRSLTNVDWLIFNGIKLGESDLDYLVDGASDRSCHLRALEVSNCGLSVHDIDLLLSTLSVQESTMEVINIAGVQGRISPEIFQKQIGYFDRIRRINLSRTQKTSGPQPLIPPETLMSWRLEELILSQTSINEQTLESVAAYLASPQSEWLSELHLDQCGMTGRDLAILFRCIPREGKERRPMHISANENRLHVGYSELFDAIGHNMSPSHLTMRMICFDKERHFRELVTGLRKNTTIIALDISKASLPYDATPETCDELQKFFAENHTLQELDISGDNSHLDAARFGIGLNHALTGLKENKCLRVLRIEYQNLGFQGANTLASVLECNDTLQEVHCENNDITLQCFTALLNGLQQNHTLLYLPSLERDRDISVEKVKREIQLMNSSNENVSQPASNSLRRTFSFVGGTKPIRQATAGAASKTGFSGSPRNSHAPSASADSDIYTAVNAIQRQWVAETERMHRYLQRNRSILLGEEYYDEEVDPGRKQSVSVGGGKFGRGSSSGEHRDPLATATTSASTLSEMEPVHMDGRGVYPGGSSQDLGQGVSSPEEDDLNDPEDEDDLDEKVTMRYLEISEKVGSPKSRQSLDKDRENKRIG